MSLPSDIAAAAQKADLGDHVVVLDRLRPLRGGLTVWIFEHGFVAADKHGTKLYAWVRCRLRYGKVTSQGSTSVNVTVLHDGGAEFKLAGSGGNKDLQTFLDRAIDGITPARLPRAYEALVNRERLDFGPVQVDLEALHHKGRPIPWAEMDTCGLDNGSLVVRRTGKWSVTSVGVSAITDVHVLMTVVDRIPAAPGSQSFSIDDIKTRKWAQAVIAEKRLGEDDFDWRDGGPLGRVPTIKDAGRRRIEQGIGTTLNARGEQILADAAHANWGLTQGVHYRALKKRVVVIDGRASEQILRAGEATSWRSLVQALSARHGFVIRS